MNICIKLCWSYPSGAVLIVAPNPYSPPLKAWKCLQLRKEIFRMTNGLAPPCQPGDGQTVKGCVDMRARPPLTGGQHMCCLAPASSLATPPLSCGPLDSKSVQICNPTR